MTEPHILADDLRFPEAPRWHQGALWFSDMIAHAVHRLDASGRRQTVATFDEMPGGLGFLPDGTVLVAGMHSGRLYAVRDGRTDTYADLAAVAPGHLDDMAVAPDGTAYVGGVGRLTADTPPTGGSIVRVAPPAGAGAQGGRVTREASDLAFPNGAVVTPDGRTLLVNETFAERTLAYDIRPDGTLAGQRVWAPLPGLHPDGLALDAAGAAWVGCYSESVFVRVEEGGAVTDRIDVGDRWATGVELGGDDGDTLFLMTADTDNDRFFRGDSAGRIQTVRVDVPRATRPGDG